MFSVGRCGGSLSLNRSPAETRRAPKRKVDIDPSAKANFTRIHCDRIQTTTGVNSIQLAGYQSPKIRREHSSFTDHLSEIQVKFLLERIKIFRGDNGGLNFKSEGANHLE